MKKTILFFVTFLATIAVSAQSRMSYSLEFVAGVGVGKGPQVSFSPEFVAQYNLGDLVMGVGAGVRYARPCKVYDTKHGRGFHDEVDIPVFLRLGYGKSKFFTHVDAGYAIGVLGYPGVDYVPGAKKDFLYDGLFFEPQVGLKVGRRGAFALGVLLQQSDWHNQVWDVGETTTVYVRDTKNAFTPAITLRYVLEF